MDVAEQFVLPEAALRESDSNAAAGGAFSALVERQSRFVFRVAFSILRNVEDAEDVVQEAFLKLYRNGQWKAMEDERAFLARVVWRIAVDRLPKRRAEEPHVDLAAADNPERRAIDADWNATVHRLIDALPEELRQPLALSAVHEMTSQQVASVLGIPEGTVRSRVSRARQILREKLEVVMGRRL